MIMCVIHALTRTYVHVLKLHKSFDGKYRVSVTR